MSRTGERIAGFVVVVAVVVVCGVVGQETCLDSVSCATSVSLGSSNLFCKSFWENGVKVAYVCIKAQNEESIDFVFRATAEYQLTSGRAGLSSDCEAIPKAWSRFQSWKSSTGAKVLTVSVDLSEVTTTSADGCCGNDLCMVFEAKVMEENEPTTAAVYRVGTGGTCYKNANGVVVCSKTLECEGCDGSLCSDTATGKGVDEGCGADLPFCDSGDGKNMGDSAPGDTCRLCAGRGATAKVDWNCPDETPDCVDSSGSAVKWQELGDQCVCLLTVDSCVGEEVVDMDTCLCSCMIKEGDCVGSEMFDGTGCACSCPLSDGDCTAPLTLDEDACACTCPLTDGDCTAPLTLEEDACACTCPLTDGDCTAPLTLDEDTCACTCPLTDGDCTAPLTLDEDACACTCPLSESDCVAPYTFDADSCACTCPLSQDDCAGLETFDASSCECVCPDVSGTDICSVGTEVFDETSGVCDCVACPIEFDQVGSGILGSGAGDYAGWSVAMSKDGKRVAIGSIFHNNQAGEVRVFEYDEAQGWVQLGLAIDGERAGDRSGHSLAMSSDGNRIAIGAPYNRGGGTEAGHVRVFEYDADDSAGWVQLGLDIDGESIGDQSGIAVAFSAAGDIVAIGATLNAGTGTSAGHVRVFQYDDTLGWVQLGLDIDAEAPGDLSGAAVALSSDGMRVAIGATGNDGKDRWAGHVRVFDYDETAGWVQVGQDMDGEKKYDYSGGKLALSGDGSRVAIGASGNDGNGERSGHVRVYEFREDTLRWTKVGQDIDGEAAGDFSSVVEMSSDGTRIAIGAPNNTADGLGDRVGHVRVFEWQEDDNQWQQMGPDIDGEGEGSHAGTGLAMSGDGTRVAIGSPTNQAGLVRVFDISYNCK